MSPLNFLAPRQATFTLAATWQRDQGSLPASLPLSPAAAAIYFQGAPLPWPPLNSRNCQGAQPCPSASYSPLTLPTELGCSGPLPCPGTFSGHPVSRSPSPFTEELLVCLRGPWFLLGSNRARAANQPPCGGLPSLQVPPLPASPRGGGRPGRHDARPAAAQSLNALSPSGPLGADRPWEAGGSPSPNPALPSCRDAQTPNTARCHRSLVGLMIERLHGGTRTAAGPPPATRHLNEPLPASSFRRGPAHFRRGCPARCLRAQTSGATLTEHPPPRPAPAWA